jgi:hypothetical protein
MNENMKAIEVIKKIAEDEAKKLHIVEMGIVTSIFPHANAGERLSIFFWFENHTDHRVHREKRQLSVYSVYSVVDYICKYSYFKKKLKSLSCYCMKKINNELKRTPCELTLPEFVSVRISSLFFSY